MPSRPWFLPLLLGAMAAFGPLATDMYLPAFPAIAAGLPAEPAAVQVTLATYFAGTALGQLAYGPLADRFGRRPALLLGLLVFTLASIGCALTGSVETLTWLRLGQGLGGCAGMVVARAIVRDVTTGHDSIRLMAQLMLVMGLAPILAPSLGGLLLAVADWRAIFWVLAGYSAGLAVLCWFALPETLEPERRRREGPLGILLTYARLLRQRVFLGHALAGALSTAGMFAYIAGSPFVFMDLFAVPPDRYALFFGMNALGLIAVGQVNARLVRRVPAERALAVAQAVMLAAGLLLLGAAATGLGGFTALVVLIFTFVACNGAVMPLATTLAMASQARAAGSASAVIGTLQFGVGAVAGALVGALHTGTALPMAAVMAGCGVLAPLASRLTRADRGAA
ncbi:Bcr/CflA family multidrug efflux MFS transporter [Paracraurococcus ruber]|uniref:Bcr/CflA family efflux transporter n=1 Tax=Paracraurococcus ruber TaxID=77675 RepID=A0ABS1CW32_9PROT|nr:Bcr/CflA family multidrug efflux MFS transporter [Paracraurococcus ruber]MBK1658516.1 Bcr/CflA family drug resistance efflux transporter [Paracraurococcus ruber]TDG32500.1 Bcr/CflA family multidrug efflux MFS transporter [Paracraurococcus ruber]